MSDVDIRPTPFDDPAAQLLVAAAQQDVVERYGGPDETPIDPRDFIPPAGCFFVAWRDGEPVACAGWRSLGDGVGEIKRMYAVPAHRGTGVAAAVLSAVEDSARAHGHRRLVLETGLAQPEAMRFYTKNGYRQIPNYGYYKDYPDCVSFGRDL